MLNKISERDESKPPIQPDIPELRAFWWEDNEIQVRDVAEGIYDKEEFAPDGRRHLTFDPWKFVGEIDLNTKRGWIDDCHVNPKYRNQGIAKKFIQSFINLCKQYGIKQIDGISYNSAVDFWKHNDFEIKPKNTDPRDPRDITNYIYKKISSRENNMHPKIVTNAIVLA